MSTGTTKLYYLEHLFNQYLEPNDIIDKIPALAIYTEVGDKIRRVRGDEIQSRKERVHIFLEWFEEYEPEQGHKLVELLDILRTDESYEWLVPILDDCKVLGPDFVECLEKFEKIEKVKGILQLLFPALKHINTNDVLDHMYSVFNPVDREDIRKVLDVQSNRYGLYSLLNRLIYKKPGWIEVFIRSIEQIPYGASEMFEESKEYCTLGEALRDYFGCYNADSDGSTQEENMEISCEGGEPMMESAARTDKKIKNFLKHDATSDDFKKPTAVGMATEEYHACEVDEIKPCNEEDNIVQKSAESNDIRRGYQKELCKLPLLGHNVIICAPTGSGKTVVAAHIIKEHLKEQKCGKVAFFTPTGGLAQQQFEKMKQYLPQMDGIEMLRGNFETRFEKDFKRKIFSSELIVMTPKILLNCLENKSVQSVFEFTMLIFDECHHARASHPYTEILKKYLEGRGPEKSIQIIGLTATLGVGPAEKEEDAIAHIYKLLGIMDASGGIVSVKDPVNLDELNEKCHTAGEETKFLSTCDEDDFKKLIKAAIQKIVVKLKEIGAFEEVMKDDLPKEVGNHNKEFDGWCQKLRHVSSNHVDEEGTGTLGRDAVSCADTMLCLKSAYSLCHNCQPSDALKKIDYFIIERFEENQEKNTDVEKYLHTLLKETEIELETCIREIGSENEMLMIIEEKIKQKQEEDPDFRCMIMVSRRLYAECLKQWIESSELLVGLHALIYIGVGSKSTSELQGMTHKKQSQTIESFRNGSCRVLVCTADAAGEGIDIPDCNLVITIDCVRNEISRGQLGGRARKENSEVLHIYFGNNTLRDKLPLEKELLMQRATRAIDKTFIREKEKYRREMNCGKMKALELLENAERKRRSFPTPQTGRRDSLLCRNCSAFICTTSDLIRMKGNHHTVNDPDFRSKYRRSNHPLRGVFGATNTTEEAYRIRCCECKCDWGREVPWDGYSIPLLSIKGFKIRDNRRGKVYTPSQWNRTRLKIPEKLFDEAMYGRLFEKTPKKD